MFSKKLFLLPFLTLFFFLSASLAQSSTKNDTDEDIVAKIGSEYKYTFNDLAKYVFDWAYNKRFNRNMKEGFSSALDSMVTNQLKRIDFFARGLNKDKILMQSIRRIIREEVVLEYYNTQYLGKYTTDDFAKKIYNIADKQVKYQRILLRLPEKASGEKKDSVKKKAMEIKDEIEKGKDFGQLVKQYSQDSLSINTNGLVPAVGWEQSLSDPIGGVIFHLNYGDVRVLNSQEGFYIIKIVEIIKNDLKPFEQIKNELKAKLKQIYSDKSIIEFRDDKAKSVDEKSVKWNNDALTKIVNWSRLQGFYTNFYQDTLKDAISKNNFTILTYPEGKLDLKDYLNILNNVLLPRSSQSVNVEDMKWFIIEAMQTEKIIEKAEKLDIEERIFNVNTTNPILRNEIVILYNQAVVDSQIPNPSKEMLHKFYNEQKDSLYHLLHKVNIYSMIFQDEKQAAETMQRIKSGTPYEKISGNWFVKTFVRERDGSIKSFLSTEEPFLGKASMKLKLNEIAGPIKYYDPQEKVYRFAVIKCVNIRPEKKLLYSDVTKTIVQDFRGKTRELMMKEIRDQLWKKYDAKIFMDVVLRNLTARTNNSFMNKTEN